MFLRIYYNSLVCLLNAALRGVVGSLRGGRLGRASASHIANE